MSGTSPEKFLRDRVMAIVISQGHDFPYLAQTLQAIAEQTHQPDVVIIGTESDVELPFLHRALPQAKLYTIGSQPSFGQAVSHLRNEAAKDNEHIDDDISWLWLIHADSAPEARALELQLRVAETSNYIGAVGPKHVGWEENPRTLLEVGIRATRSARRVPEVEPGELDQGQLDSRTDVLAVGSAGMLASVQAWQEVGGLDPQLGPFGDGLEFSRRLRVAGYRVIVEPQAYVRHAQVSLGSSLAQSFAARRTAQTYNALLAAPLLLFPLLWLGYILGSIPRALIRLAGNEASYARAELSAGVALLGKLGALFTARRRLRRVRKVPRRALSALEARPWSIRLAKRQTRLAHADAAAMEQAPDALTLKERIAYIRVVRIGRMVILAIAAVIAGVLFIPIAGHGSFIGGGLAHSSLTGPDLVEQIWRGWIPAGDGYPGAIDSLWVVAAIPLLILSPLQITLGQLVTVVLYLALPIVALLAYAAVGRIVVSWMARVLLTLVWMVSPAFLDALLTGRIAGVVAYIGLTGCAYACAGAWRARGRDGAVLAFFVMLAAVGSPIYALLAVVVAVIALVIAPHGRRWRWVLIPLPAIFLQLPGLRWGGLGYFLTSAGVPQLHSYDPRAVVTLSSAKTLVFSWPQLLGYVLPATLVIFAVLALVRPSGYGRIRIAWLWAICGIAWALGATQAVTIVPGTWPGFGQQLSWGALVVVVACAGAGGRTYLRTHSFGIRHLVVGVLSLVLTASWVVSAGFVVATSANNRVIDGDTEIHIPAVGEADQRAGYKVLELEATPDGVDAQLWRGQGVELTEYTMAAQAQPVDSGAREHLAQTIANIMGRADAVASDLFIHGIRVIVVPPGQSQQRSELVAALNSLPHVSYISAHDAGDFWRVAPVGEIAFMAHPGNPKNIQPSASERIIAIPERANPHWHAYLDDAELVSQERQWQQVFVVPARAHGELTISYIDWVHRFFTIGQFVLIILVTIAALPLFRKRLSI